MDFDYNTIRYAASEAELDNQTFTLIQTFLLDTMTEYIRTTIFTSENKIIHSSEEFHSRLTKKTFTPKEKIINKINKESIIFEKTAWAQKMIFSFYHSSKKVKYMNFDLKTHSSARSIKAILEDFEGAIFTEFKNNEFLSFYLSNQEPLFIAKKDCIKIIDLDSFLSESMEKTKENILSYPSFRLKKLFLS